MKIILLKDYQKIGRRGEIKEVSDGLAKNLLIPKGIAILATEQRENKIKKEAQEVEQKKEREISKANNLKSNLERKVFTLEIKVGEKGQLFGGVRDKDIIRVLNEKMGTHFSFKVVENLSRIKAVGEHKVQITLAGNVKANITINIIPKS